MKKTFAILLAACLLVGTLAGCAGTGAQSHEASPTPTVTAPPAGAHDWAAAYAKHKTDEVVLTVNGSDVTWAEYFYWLFYNLNSMEAYLGPIADFSEVFAYGDGKQTTNEYFVSAARDYVVQYHAMEINSKAAGAKLTAEDEKSLKELLASDMVSTCGEDATPEDFQAYLASVYVTPEVYDYINVVSCLYKNCFDILYGADGEKLADEDVSAFIDANSYMTARHILVSTMDAEGAALDDAAKAEKLAVAQEIADKLAAEKDKTKQLALFNELQTEYNEDPGTATYPEGYCFPTGKMDPAFEAGTAALAENEISGIVESTMGYHIILRLPTTADTVVQYYSADEQYDLRYVAAMDAYNVLVGNWLTDAEVVWQPDFENFDLNTL
ncbi:MAG: peptidylprolyl isomerase, partial [Oscillospiraceae bacterium]